VELYCCLSNLGQWVFRTKVSGERWINV